MNDKTLIQIVGLKTYYKITESYNKSVDKFRKAGIIAEDLHGCLFVAGKYIYSPLDDRFRCLGWRTWYGNGFDFIIDCVNGK